MTVFLDGPRMPPARGGKPDALVILLHGYGSNGEDLISLAPFFAQALPEAEFLSPNAPFPCQIAAFGFQWFGFEGRTPETIVERINARPLSWKSSASVAYSLG